MAGFFRYDSERGAPQQLRASFAMSTAIRMITNLVEWETNAVADAKLQKSAKFLHSSAAVFRNFGRSRWPTLPPDPFRGRSVPLRPSDSERC